jgi:uncharacterized protein (TIGR00255 family)
MTGFGKGEINSRFGRFTAEIRTVNHRYFDVSSRIPNNLGIFEDRIKNYLNRYIKRGKVNFSLSVKRNGRNLDSIKLDNEAVERYYKMLKRLNKRFKLKDEIKLAHILSFPDVLVQEQIDYDATSIWPVLESVVKKAAFDCNRMREREGRALCKDLTMRIKKISMSIEKITSLAPGLITQYKNKLESKIKDILKDHNYAIDRSRLETELAIFAKQSDISEEITRAKSHITALKNALESTEEAGRRLDFILQELQREVNTLGSKATSIKISQLVVDIKSEIEKIREQVQNVE